MIKNILSNKSGNPESLKKNQSSWKALQLMLVLQFHDYYQYYRLIFMAVTTLEGEKIGAQKTKCNGLFLLDYINSKTDMKYVNIYSKTTKYCSPS